MNDKNHLNEVPVVFSQARKLVVFQIKLYLDTIRDIALLPLSFFAFLLDMVLARTGPESYFERLMQLGGKSDQAINLFNQYDIDTSETGVVDSLINSVEERVSQSYRNSMN